MAFCPNCGTPNTDQVEKCVACGFELSQKQQKAKFKGTIMMSGIKATGGVPSLATAPTQPPPPAPEAPAAPTASLPPPASEPLPPTRNPNFQKTMVGHMAPPPRAPGGAGAPAAPAAPSVPMAPRTPAELRSTAAEGRAPTMMGTGAQFGVPAHPESPAGAPSRTTFGTDGAGTAPGHAAAPGYGEPGSPGVPRVDTPSRGSFDGGISRASGYEGTGSGRMSGFDSMAPQNEATKPSPGKVLAIGCVGAAAVFFIVTALLWYALGPKIRAWMNGNQSDTEAVAWQASITQSLTQVAELCQRNCQEASPYFHQAKQLALLGESKLLTPARAQKLGDIANTKAEMLHNTDDAALAKELGLDPQQCARVLAGTAKVISCSVPEPGSPRSVLRIVHLSGIGTL